MLVSDRYANFGTIDMTYQRSDTTNNRYRYPILRITCLLCLQWNA